MNSPLKMLVVEDRVNHIADCQTMLEEVLPRIPIRVNVLWARDLQEAASLLPQADAVMTDVFFPTAPGGNAEEPNGQVVVERCLDQSKPVVWVTSTYHHGKRTDPVSRWGRERGLRMFDCRSAESNCCNDAEDQHKPWKKALYGLFYLILALEGGHYVISDGVLENRGSASAHPNNFASIYLRPEKYPEVGEHSEGDPVWAKVLELGFPRS
jgi:hypothetical protein